MNVRRYINEERRTGSSLPNFLRHDPKDRDNLDHNFDDNVSHGRRRSDFYIRLKSLEEVFHTVKQINKSVFASADVLDSLGSI